MDGSRQGSGSAPGNQDTIGELLAELQASQKEIRAEAARKLGQSGARAVPGLLKALQNANWVVRYRAVEALTAIADPRVDTALIKSLNDKRDHVRYMAAKGLGFRNVPAASTPLLGALQDENEFVRICVARSLAQGRYPGALAALQEAIRNETIPRVAEEMGKARDRLQECENRAR
jgi:FOG: HEAT repeat